MRSTSPMSPTVPATIGVTRLMQERSHANWGGVPQKPLKLACAKPCSGTWRTKTGLPKFNRAATVSGSSKTTANEHHEDSAAGQEWPGGLGTATQPGPLGSGHCIGVQRYRSA